MADDGWAYQELSLFAATQYDQDQWGHAFGMVWFAPYTSDQAGAVTAENVVNWYWGTNKGTTYSGGDARRCTSSTRASSSRGRS